MEPYNPLAVSALHEPQLLPDGQNKSMVPDKPALNEDLSHLNSPHWRKMAATGSRPKPGNRRKARAKRVGKTPTCLALVKWVAQGTWAPA